VAQEIQEKWGNPDFGGSGAANWQALPKIQWDPRAYNCELLK